MRHPARSSLFFSFPLRAVYSLPHPMALVLLPVLIPACLTAQSVRGVLVEQATGRPIPGAFVVLVDETGRDRDGTLSGAEGTYLLQAPAAGRYRLRADRIGYESTLSAPFGLAAGESKAFRMRVSPAPVHLRELRVERESRCRKRPEEGRDIYALWQEARKALEVARWTEARRQYRYDVVSYRRALDRRGKRVLAERLDTLRYAARLPFRARSPEALAATGYVLSSADTTAFYGPDAGVLLSDDFQESHCFGIERGKGDGGEGWAGLSFQPVPGRKRPDIEGVLWLDEATAELRRVEFRYTRWRGPRTLPRAGGRVEFERQPTGEWIVPRWWIRMPLRRRDRRYIYEGLMEDGAYVTAVHEASATAPSAPVEAPVERLEWPAELRGESIRVMHERRGKGAGPERDGIPAPEAPGADAFLPPEIVKSLSVYRAPPDSGRVVGLLREWKAVAGGPAGPRGRIAAAELWRRVSEVELAVRALGSKPVGEARALWELERARIGFSGPDAGDGYVEAEAALSRACAGLDGEVKGEVWQDLRGLATPEEQVAWAVLPASPSTCGWLRHFVGERAWRMGLSMGERLALHYRRLDHVRRSYWLKQPRLRRDMADELGRPDSLEVDDRGLVYLRMGAPDRTATWVPPAEIHPNESWAYYQATGERFYHFAPVSKVGETSVADYRLLRTLAEVTGVTLLDELINQVTLEDVADLYASRVALDGSFSRLAHRLTELRISIETGVEDRGVLNRGLADLGEEKQQTYRDARWAIQGVPDEPAVGGLQVSGEALRFWNPDSGSWSVWLVGQAGGEGLQGRHEGGGYRYEVTAELSLRGPDSLLTRRGSVKLERAAKFAENEGVTFRLPLQLGSGRYPYTLVVRDRSMGEEGRGAWLRDTLVVPEQGPGLPAVSDLAVATDSGGSWTRDGRTYLKVTPSHVVGRTGALHVYFEVYGLEPGAAYELEFRLVKQGKANRMYELAPGEVAFRLRSKGEMPRSGPAVARRHMRLELGATKPGKYVLGVRVRDEATGAESLQSVTTVLVSGGR